MAERIPQSIAYLVVFRAFLAADGKTPATGKTIAVTISKNGGAFGNPAVGALNATEISSGFYKFTLAAGDTDTLGPLAWRGAEGTINDAGDVLTVVLAELKPYAVGTVTDASPAAGDFTGDSALSALDDFYNEQWVAFDQGGGLHPVARKVTDYVGAERRFLFTGTGDTADDRPFPAAPTNGDRFAILGHG